MDPGVAASALSTQQLAPAFFIPDSVEELGGEVDTKSLSSTQIACFALSAKPSNEVFIPTSGLCRDVAEPDFGVESRCRPSLQMKFSSQLQGCRDVSEHNFGVESRCRPRLQ
jgi:hypothetical protein